VLRLDAHTADTFVTLAVLAALLFASTLAAEDGSLDQSLDLHEPVVPPGQDQLLAEMVGRGAPLPDDCKFAGGGADGPVIQTTYTCPSGKIVFELVHPDNAGDEATLTEQFAITLKSGTPPEGLEEVLVWLIRQREADFEWLWLTDEDEDPNAGEDEDPLPGDS
jgi:hypothetical protein